eukprot:4965050-Pyramimonas_sp.AAC.1
MGEDPVHKCARFVNSWPRFPSRLRPRLLCRVIGGKNADDRMDEDTGLHECARFANSWPRFPSRLRPRHLCKIRVSKSVDDNMDADTGYQSPRVRNICEPLRRLAIAA